MVRKGKKEKEKDPKINGMHSLGEDAQVFTLERWTAGLLGYKKGGGLEGPYSGQDGQRKKGFVGGALQRKASGKRGTEKNETNEKNIGRGGPALLG